MQRHFGDVVARVQIDLLPFCRLPIDPSEPVVQSYLQHHHLFLHQPGKGHAFAQVVALHVVPCQGGLVGDVVAVLVFDLRFHSGGTEQRSEGHIHIIARELHHLLSENNALCIAQRELVNGAVEHAGESVHTALGHHVPAQLAAFGVQQFEEHIPIEIYVQAGQVHGQGFHVHGHEAELTPQGAGLIEGQCLRRNANGQPFRHVMEHIGGTGRGRRNGGVQDYFAQARTVVECLIAHGLNGCRQHHRLQFRQARKRPCGGVLVPGRAAEISGPDMDAVADEIIVGRVHLAHYRQVQYTLVVLRQRAYGVHQMPGREMVNDHLSGLYIEVVDARVNG